MGNKKKRSHPDLEELMQRPWCYYCERDFDDLKILIDHQRAKHFKCEKCGRRLNTAGGLQVHMNQVHKETLTSIDNALPNRSNLDVEIFGTEGIPADVAEQHRQRVVTQFVQAESERRAATGNAAPGVTNGAGAAKKAKTESLDDIKKRKAEFKAKKAAEAAAAATATQQGVNGSGVSTPTDPAATHLMPTGLAHQGPPGAFQQPYGGGPPFVPPGQTFSPPQHISAFSPPMMNNFGQPQFQPPPQSFSQGNGFPPGFSNGMPPDFHARSFGATSPPMPFSHQGQYPPPSAHAPVPSPIGLQGSPISGMAFGAPPGLPQRPAVGAPPVNAAAMQQMHQGQIPSNINNHSGQANGQQFRASNSATPTVQVPAPEAKAPMPAPAAPKAEAEAAAAAAAAPPPPPTEKPEKSKKSKKEEKATRMVYSDNDVSPEEKMSKNPRYAFHREDKPEEVLQQVDDEMRGALSAPKGDTEM